MPFPLTKALCTRPKPFKRTMRFTLKTSTTGNLPSPSQTLAALRGERLDHSQTRRATAQHTQHVNKNNAAARSAVVHHQHQTIQQPRGKAFA